MDRIYFDNAATTKMRDEVFEEIRKYSQSEYGNPSSVYEPARAAKKAVDGAREAIAKVILAAPDEIFFTGSGTESDNWAIRGAVEANKSKGNHIITSVIEHHAVLHTCENLEKNGFEVTYLPVDEHGIVRIEDLKAAVRPSTILITIMYANNEIGTIQPIRKIGQIANEQGIIFHTDAVQAFGHIDIDVNEQYISLMSISAHKIYGPKGCGALYIKKGTKLSNLIFGGAQEKRRRAGTENVAGIAAFGRAAELAHAEMKEERRKTEDLRDYLIKGILDNIPHTRLNGHPVLRLPGNVNISFEFIEGESILLMLDMKGISASSGSACTSGSLDPSHVLLGIGLPHEKAHGSLRITLGRFNTQEEADKLLELLPPIIKRLRDMSPLYEEYLKKQ